MFQAILKWVKVAYKKVVTSIAFLPAVITISFLLLSLGMITLDFSSLGKSIKADLHWLSLKDASTARSICSTIASGIISLSVFSFSMVMILLNQAANQMSNRILGKLIGNRLQQFILGFYIGTIVYALFLLSTIRDIDSGIHVPAISTYLLIVLAVADIFLFIYFLHYITESVKFETIIHTIHETTKNEMAKTCLSKEAGIQPSGAEETIVVNASKSGLFMGFSREPLIALCNKYDSVVTFLKRTGVYTIEGSPILTVRSRNKLPDDFEENLHILINIDRAQEIKKNYSYGFIQLMEIAVKALSPGINDPGTAVISLSALGDLLAYRQRHSPEIYLRDECNNVRVIMNEYSFEEIVEQAILPIWDYGKEDRLMQNAMVNIFTQLNAKRESPIIEKLLRAVYLKIEQRNFN